MSRNMKKGQRITLFLSAVVLAALLPMSGSLAEGGQVPDSDTTIRVWFDSNEGENNALRQIAAIYEREKGVHVEVIDRRSVFDAPDDLVNNADVESGPDLVLMQAPDIGDLAVSGYLEPLKLNDELRARFTQTAIDAFTLNGQIYGIGYSIETSGLIYNKDLISPEELPKNWEEFFRTAEALTIPDSSGGYLQYGTLLNSRDMWFTYPIIREYGGYYYGELNGTYNPLDIGLNNEGMLAYVDKIKEAKRKGLVLPTAIGMESHIVAQFAKGNVAMILYGLWSSSTFRSAGISYGLAELPAHSDGSASLPLATVVGFVVNAHSTHIPQAIDFLYYLCRDENQQALIEAGNKWEQKTGSRNPACLSVIESEYIQSDEILSVLAQIGAECEPFPNIPEGTIWYNYTNTAFKAIFFGDADGNEVGAGAKLDELVASIAADVKTMNAVPEPVEIEGWVYWLLGAAAVLAMLLIVLRLWKKARSGMYRDYSKRITILAWCLMIPMLTALLLFYVFPIFHNVYISMTDYSGLNLNDIHFIGFYNYQQVFSKGLHSLAGLLLWTLVFALSVVGLSFVFGTWLATVLNKVNRWASNAYRMIYILPWVIPTVITLLMWQGLLADDGGLINRILSFVGLGPVPFLSDPWWARVSVIVVMVWFSFPYYMVVALGFIQSINKDCYEAARLDGASRGQIFRRITLPIVFQAMVPTLVMGFIMQFNQFGVYMLTAGGPAAGRLGDPGATDLLITYVFNLAFNTKRYAMAAAYSVLIFLFVSVFSLIVLRTNRGQPPSHKLRVRRAAR